MIKIIGVYDNEGKTFDRYTIVFNEKEGIFYNCLGLSFNPDSPQGFSQWSTCQDGNHLGKKVSFESLPINIQNHVIERMK